MGREGAHVDLKDVVLAVAFERRGGVVRGGDVEDVGGGFDDAEEGGCFGKGVEEDGGVGGEGVDLVEAGLREFCGEDLAVGADCEVFDPGAGGEGVDDACWEWVCHVGDFGVYWEGGMGLVGGEGKGVGYELGEEHTSYDTDG